VGVLLGVKPLISRYLIVSFSCSPAIALVSFELEAFHIELPIAGSRAVHSMSAYMSGEFDWSTTYPSRIKRSQSPT
jgi:hypothetical protein